MARNRKERLFDQGVSAATAVLGAKKTYFCPICASGYSAHALVQGELTLEHVPPKSQGGRAIILTCRSCNNVAGYTVDADAAGRSELDSFAKIASGTRAGEGGLTVLKIGEHKIRVELSNDGSTTVFKVVGAANNPETVEKAMNELRQANEDGSIEGFKMRVSKWARYNPKLAQVSDLRAAFLACTAALGYRFAFSKALKAVREQILNPKQDLISHWSIKPTASVVEPAMAISEDRGVVIILFKTGGVVLPWPPAGDDGFREAAAEADRCKKVTFQAIPLEWPRSFKAMWDQTDMNAR